MLLAILNGSDVSYILLKKGPGGQFSLFRAFRCCMHNITLKPGSGLRKKLAHVVPNSLSVPGVQSGAPGAAVAISRGLCSTKEVFLHEWWW